ncbi:hypothetical protein K0U83_03560, partial [bacterium]|nr:hypothetical protein [bacterium]
MRRSYRTPSRHPHLSPGIRFFATVPVVCAGPRSRIVTLARRELGGRWVATKATDDVRRFGIGLDSDDSTWSEIAVPGHWQHDPHFSDSNGPLMYRNRFTAQPPADGLRRWITFDGIFYQGDAWLDGAYLGDSEGYFFPH